MTKHGVIYFSLLCAVTLFGSIHCYGNDDTRDDSYVILKNDRLTKPTRFIKEAVCDVGSMFKNFIHWDSFKTVAATFPLFIAGRLIDEPIHECFYDKKCHKNIHQMPHFFNDIAGRGVVDSISAFSIGSFLWSKNQRLRETSKMFLLGLPFIGWTTNAIKACCKYDICYRPLHEKHSKNHRKSYGGFPSTHAAQVTYATVLFGLQFGAVAAVPLAVLGSLVVVPFINGNRHYVSQIIAGAGLGTLYGLASNKVVNKHFNNDTSFKIGFNNVGAPSLIMSYAF